MILGLVIGTLWGLSLATCVAHVRAHRDTKPVNVVGGVLLPHPSDERWASRSARNCSHHLAWALGDIEACTHPAHGVSVTWGQWLKGSVPYARAVAKAQIERKALEAIS